MTTDVYIVGLCPCGGRIIAPVLGKHFVPQPPVCERSGLEFCTAPVPDEVVAEPPPLPKKFIMEWH